MMSIPRLHLGLLAAVTLIAVVIQLFARYREQSRDRLPSARRHQPP